MAMFANEYHEGSHGTGRIINTIRAGLLPDKPASWQCAKYPHIKPWMKKEYHAAVNALTNTQWGATDGDAATVQKKGKRGHPWKKTDDDLEDTDNTPTHFYLQNPDGMPISSKEIAEMSQKARMLWRMLDEDNMAPPTFGQISLKAWEFFSLTMLTDEAHEFLLLCSNREWFTRSYPSWHHNRFNQKDKDDDRASHQGKNCVSRLQSTQRIHIGAIREPTPNGATPEPGVQNVEDGNMGPSNNDHHHRSRQWQRWQQPNWPRSSQWWKQHGTQVRRLWRKSNTSLDAYIGKYRSLYFTILTTGLRPRVPSLHLLGHRPSTIHCVYICHCRLRPLLISLSLSDWETPPPINEGMQIPYRGTKLTMWS